jgi:hypothetical protein
MHFAMITLFLVVTPHQTDAALPKELRPKLFSLRGDHLPLSKVLSELTRQTENRVVDRRTKKTELLLDLDLNRVTFWQALDAIAEKARLGIRLYDQENAILLGDGPYRKAPVSYESLFRIALGDIECKRSFISGNHSCLVQLEIAWEPRFRPLLLTTDGKSAVSIAGKHAIELPIDIPAPDRSLKTLQMRGNASVIGPDRMLSFTFDRLSSIDKPDLVRSENQDGVTVQLRSFRSEGESSGQVWTAEVALSYPAGGPEFQSYQSWITNNVVYLSRTRDGKTEYLPSNLGHETGEMSANHAVVRYHFGTDRKRKIALGQMSDWKLVYVTPHRLVAVPVAFEFKDVLLP